MTKTKVVPDEIKSSAASVHFDAVPVWVSGQFDRPDVLLAALKEKPGLEDYVDGLGNAQGAVRLDYDPENKNGLWVLVPSSVDHGVISEAVSAYPDKLSEIETEETEASSFPRNLDPGTRELFIRASDAIANANSLDEIKSAFAGLKADLQN